MIFNTGLIATDVESIQKVLLKYPGIEQAILYGSRAKGSYKKGSDIDLTIVGILSCQDFHQLECELDDLMLPYQFDLSLYHQIENQALKNHIKCVGKELYPSQIPH